MRMVSVVIPGSPMIQLASVDRASMGSQEGLGGALASFYTKMVVICALFYMSVRII